MVKLATQRKSLTHYTKGTPSPDHSIALPLRLDAVHQQHSHATVSLDRAFSVSRHSLTLIRLIVSNLPLPAGSCLLPTCIVLRQSTPKILGRAGIELVRILRVSQHIKVVHDRSKAIEWSGSDCLYAYGFRFYFTPLSGVLFAFPSRYWFTIGRSGVFSLGGWSPHVQTGFLVPRPTHFHRTSPFVYRAITVYGGPFQTLPLKLVQLLG